MKAFLLVFTPILLSISEGSLLIPEGGITQAFIIGEKRPSVVVETPQFQEDVFIPETEVASEEIEESFGNEMAEDETKLEKEIFEDSTAAEKSETLEESEVLEKKAVVEEQATEKNRSEETASRAKAGPTELKEEHPLAVEFEASKDAVEPCKVGCFKEEEPCEVFEHCFDYSDPYCDPLKKWYLSLKPGYFYFKDNDMNQFFDGGFSLRAETGCRFWDYYMVWIDASYFQKKGCAIGGTESLKIKLATITLGLKGIYYFNRWAAIYGGLGPRLFMMLLHNSSPFVRSDDNEVGIGGGFQAGVWLFPVPQWENLYLDVFADYSLKDLKVQPDEISSIDNDIDVSGFTGGIGIGFRF